MRLFAAALLACIPAAYAAPLDAYRWKARVVVASAPRANDPALARQRAIFDEMGREARARDLMLVEAVGSEGRATRRALGLPEGVFAAALVGKDGEVKLRASRPLDAAALFPLIDGMPMRRQERRERGEWSAEQPGFGKNLDQPPGSRLHPAGEKRHAR